MTLDEKLFWIELIKAYKACGSDALVALEKKMREEHAVEKEGKK